jgi:hypothetical protein
MDEWQFCGESLFFLQMDHVVLVAVNERRICAIGQDDREKVKEERSSSSNGEFHRDDDDRSKVAWWVCSEGLWLSASGGVRVG